MTPGRAVERALLGLVTSAHIACGGHAGDEDSMRATTLVAKQNGVRVGAHPSYPDRDGFGRRPMEMSPRDLSSALGSQIGALIDVAAALEVTVQSVKPHGALYGEVAHGTAAFDALLAVILELCGPAVSLVLPSGAPAVERAKEAGVHVLERVSPTAPTRRPAELVARQEPGRRLPRAVAGGGASARPGPRRHGDHAGRNGPLVAGGHPLRPRRFSERAGPGPGRSRGSGGGRDRGGARRAGSL